MSRVDMEKITKLYILLLIILIVSWLSLAPIETSLISDYPDRGAIEAAMRKCGPNHSYRLMMDDTLQVNRGNGWEGVRYK